MVIIKESMTLAELLIDLCAIVGGVFVIYGIANKLLQRGK
jgi:hypothetical protein